MSEAEAGFEVEGVRVTFEPRFAGEIEGPAVVVTLELAGGPDMSSPHDPVDLPEGVAVLDLLVRRVHGSGGVVLETVREHCRKRGIRFEPGPWRYSGGLL